MTASKVAPFRAKVNRKEFEAMRLSHADDFCVFEKDPERPWRWVAVFPDTDSIIKAYRSMKDREPSHAIISIPYKAVCRRLSILLLASDREEVHADGK